MKKMLAIASVLMLSATLCMAQSQQTDAVKNDKAAAKESSQPFDHVGAAIAELEKHIKDNEGKEGFEKEAYQKRLQYLYDLRSKESDN